jgi:hypothetical protein
MATPEWEGRFIHEGYSETSMPAEKRILTATEARQSQPGMGVRYVLLISTVAAAVLMGIAYITFIMP